MTTETKTIKKTKKEEKTSKTLVETHERQTIVHCKHFGQIGDGVRIWKTTFLIEKPSGTKRKLVHAENITMYPNWTVLERNGAYPFSLYFEGLSKSCTSFDLKEIIPQDGGFNVENIPRNQTDVYQVVID